jgi:hypothetical protein
MSEWPEREVRAVAKNKKLPLVQRAAAKDLLRWNSNLLTKAGFPIAGQSADRILDRSVGKPVQSVAVQHSEVAALPNLQNLSVDQLRALASILSVPLVRADVSKPLAALPQNRE